MEKIDIQASDGLVLKALYSKVSNPKALVVIVHGMVEHKERYLELIEVLNKHKYSTIIADLRGHGESINDEYKLGQIGSIDQMVSDVKTVMDYIKNDNPNVKTYLYSHSMGTLIARAFIKKYSFEIEKLILSGTVAYKPGCWLGVFAAKMKSKGKGKDKYSTLLYRMSNNGSKSEDVSWLSYNEKNVKSFMDDPLCGFKFTNYSNYVLFSMTYNLHKHEKNSVNDKLKILSISGADDRTTNHTRGVKDSIKHLKKEGFNDVKYIEYHLMKHEILAEENKNDVFSDIVSFFNS